MLQVVGARQRTCMYSVLDYAITWSSIISNLKLQCLCNSLDNFHLDIFAAGAILKKVFVLIMENIIDGMMGYVPLHYIMDKILADHGTHPFGDFRPTILNMLSAYGYERTILVFYSTPFFVPFTW